jgi:hypothetical protein
MGGLSGPAIKPLALRVVYQVARAVRIPIIGVGGIATIDDVLEFFVAGASAVQIGTANFYDPTAAARLVQALPAALDAAGVSRFSELVGSIRVPAAESAACGTVPCDAGSPGLPRDTRLGASDLAPNATDRAPAPANAEPRSNRDFVHHSRPQKHIVKR